MKCPTCGYHVRGPNHEEGRTHILHLDNPGKYVPGTTREVPKEDL